jgi:hypothetical protein
MSTNHPFAGDPNPYAPPALIEPAQPSAHSPELSRVIRDFRSQSLALGVGWVLFGAAALGWSVFLPDIGEWLQLIRLTVGVIGGCWLVAGIATVAKQPWGVLLGLVISYLAVLASALTFNICLIVILIMFILQGHRVLGYAKQIQAAGLKLNVRP